MIDLNRNDFFKILKHIKPVKSFNFLDNILSLENCQHIIPSRVNSDFWLLKEVDCLFNLKTRNCFVIRDNSLVLMDDSNVGYDSVTNVIDWSGLMILILKSIYA